MIILNTIALVTILAIAALIVRDDNRDYKKRRQDEK